MNLVLVRIWIKSNNDKRRKKVVVGKVAACLYLTLILKALRISVEHDRVVTTLNLIKHCISYFSVLEDVLTYNTTLR